jgi:hypothetical protein
MEEGMRDAADDEAALKQLLDEKAIAPNVSEVDEKMDVLVQDEVKDTTELRHAWGLLSSAEQVKEDIELEMEETEDSIQKLEFKQRLAREHMAFYGNLAAEDMDNFTDVAELSRKHTSLITILGMNELKLSESKEAMEQLMLNAEGLSERKKNLLVLACVTFNLGCMCVCVWREERREKGEGGTLEKNSSLTKYTQCVFAQIPSWLRHCSVTS